LIGTSTSLPGNVIFGLVIETSYERSALWNLSLFPHHSSSPCPCHFPALSRPCQAWPAAEETCLDDHYSSCQHCGLLSCWVLRNRHLELRPRLLVSQVPSCLRLSCPALAYPHHEGLPCPHEGLYFHHPCRVLSSWVLLSCHFHLLGSHPHPSYFQDHRLQVHPSYHPCFCRTLRLFLDLQVHPYLVHLWDLRGHPGGDLLHQRQILADWFPENCRLDPPFQVHLDHLTGLLVDLLVPRDLLLAVGFVGVHPVPLQAPLTLVP